MQWIAESSDNSSKDDSVKYKNINITTYVFYAAFDFEPELDT